MPTYRRLLAASQAVARRHPDLVAITAVGESEAGDPIDMISIGDGPMSALFVGAPHPNEVFGCLVIERLIDRLCNDAA
ncbi:M14 family zinc carboxypeptidase, partial [Burkholderia pseudomallei]